MHRLLFQQVGPRQPQSHPLCQVGATAEPRARPSGGGAPAQSQALVGAVRARVSAVAMAIVLLTSPSPGNRDAPAPWVPGFISQVSLSLACIMSWKYFSLAIRPASTLGTGHLRRLPGLRGADAGTERGRGSRGGASHSRIYCASARTRDVLSGTGLGAAVWVVNPFCSNCVCSELPVGTEGAKATTVRRSGHLPWTREACRAVCFAPDVKGASSSSRFSLKAARRVQSWT